MAQNNMDELKRENLCLRQKVELLREENEKLKQKIAEKEFEIEDWKCAYDGLLG